MIGAAELKAMKPTAWLVNIARGVLVDEHALTAALAAGEIAGAFLDATVHEPLPADDPLWSAPERDRHGALLGRRDDSHGRARRCAVPRQPRPLPPRR